MATSNAARTEGPIPVLSVTVSGYLQAADFERQLLGHSDRMSPNGRYALCFDVLAMSGYEPSVRDAYMRWNKANANRIRRVAVVTDKAMWRLVVATIGMATGGNTRAFQVLADARRWCETGAD